MGRRHPFNELTKDFTPERRRCIDRAKNELLAEMPLRRKEGSTAPASEMDLAPDLSTDGWPEKLAWATVRLGRASR